MVMKQREVQIALLGLCFCLWSCATVHSTAGRDFDGSNVNQIVKGETTANEILMTFGTPQSKQPEVDNAERWIYSFTEVTAKTTGGPFGMSTGTSTGHKKSLNLLLNKDRIVVNFTFEDGPTDPQTTKTLPF